MTVSLLLQLLCVCVCVGVCVWGAYAGKTDLQEQDEIISGLKEGIWSDCMCLCTRLLQKPKPGYMGMKEEWPTCKRR